MAFFKHKVCTEFQNKDEDKGDGVVLALQPWVPRLPSAMRLELGYWAVNILSDMRACYAALFLGSGHCINGYFVKIRRLVVYTIFVGARTRLVSYLVPPAFARQRIRAVVSSATDSISSSADESFKGHMEKRRRH